MSTTLQRTYVATHLGLGDHILCNGLIREIVKRDGPVTTFAKPQNVKSVRYMLRDVEAEVIGITVPMAFEGGYAIGFQNLDRSIPFDASFYQCANVSLDARWDSFHVDRDLAKEAQFADYFAPLKDFVFVHDDSERGMPISAALPLQCSILRPSPRHADNIWMWLTLMERAKEIHVIPSSFMFIADSFPHLGAKTTVHKYARHIPDNEWPTLRHIERVIQ